MVSNKARLYVALYACGGAPKMPGLEDTYHWALLVGPKDKETTSRGHRIHVTNSMPSKGWVFEERESSMATTNQLLVRIVIGKITDRDQVFDVLRNVPTVQDDPGWNCVVWIKEALKALQRNGKAIGTSKLEWETVRDTAMWYCNKKKEQHRFDGKGEFVMDRPATYDLLEGKETIP